MARGWESKSVEAQIESARERQSGPRPELTAEQKARRSAIEDLELSRVRVLRELAAATNPRRLEQIRAALAHLDAKLASLR